MTNKAVVVLSGGQDSTTCLYWALRQFGDVEALTFDYGQRNRIELDCAAQVAKHAGVVHTTLPIDTFAAMGGNALTDSEIAVEEAPGSGLPNTFVPGRNLIFLTFAAAFAWQRDMADLVTGVAQTDYSGYPDCRRGTIDAVEQSLTLGLERTIRIHTPLMNLTKKETVELARDLGAIDAMALTHTCYNGQRPPCGTCPACQLRARGFLEAGIADPLDSI